MAPAQTSLKKNTFGRKRIGVAFEYLQNLEGFCDFKDKCDFVKLGISKDYF